MTDKKIAEGGLITQKKWNAKLRELRLARERIAELEAKMAHEPVAWWRYEGCFADKFEKGWFQREKPESNGIPLYAASVAKPAASPSRLDWIDFAIRQMCEIPDRNSPEDFPEALIVTADEIRNAIECWLPDGVAKPAAQDCVSVPREPNPDTHGGWQLDFDWLKNVKAILRSIEGWEDCSIDLEEIEAVALAMLAASEQKT